MRYNTISNIPVALCLEVVNMTIEELVPNADYIIKAYRDGASVHKLALEFGVSDQLILKLLKMNGIAIRPKAPIVDEGDVCSRYRSGDTVSQIAGAYRVSAARVVAILKANGIAILGLWGRNPIDHSQIITLFENGMSVIEICNSLHVNRKTVDSTLHNAGFTLTRRVPIDTLEMVRLYNSGSSVKALAAHFGLSRSGITLRLKEAGITPRNRSEGMFARMAQTTKDERLRLSHKAHEAAKGRVKTVIEQSLAALTRQARVSTRSSIYEAQFLGMLEARGVHAIPQFAIGPYNCDLLVGDIAVEIFGGQWHRYGAHAAICQKRSHYILDSGFNLYAIWCGSENPITDAACDDFISFLKLTSGDPSSRRQYRVIGGAGNFVASGSADDDYISGVGTVKAA